MGGGAGTEGEGEGAGMTTGTGATTTGATGEAGATGAGAGVATGAGAGAGGGAAAVGAAEPIIGSSVCAFAAPRTAPSISAGYSFGDGIRGVANTSGDTMKGNTASVEPSGAGPV